MGALDCVSPNSGKISDSTEVFTTNMSSNSTLNEPRRDVESQLSQSRRRSFWWNIFIDVPLLAIVLTVLGLYELGVIPSHKGGFFCNDPSLSYPFRGDTVSMGAIVASVILFPFFLILVTEIFLYIDDECSLRQRLVTAVGTTLKLYRNYFYGFFFNIMTVEVMKGITGNPRPSFFDICEPDAAKTCVGSEFVTTFQCTSTKYSTWFQYDSYHSFPSGHTSLSVYCGLFMAWYLQRRAFDWRHRTIFVVPVLQMLCITYAAVCSLTRITDHRHHWWDVLAGAVIGGLSLIYAVFSLCHNFSYLNVNARSNTLEEQQHSKRTLLSNNRTIEQTS